MTQTAVRIACVQMEPRVGLKEANLTSLSRKIASAAENGAKIVVAPELCNSGYVFESSEEALALAESIRMVKLAPNG